jgi:sugar/nucleoside kinase (ribokinase family)
MNLLSDAGIEQVLARLPSLTLGVLGDLFLDRYLDLDAALTEPSIETGLDAYQVVRVRSIPGAAGTVLNNLVALGVGRVCPIAVLGDDGEGHELQQALRARSAVDPGGLIVRGDRRTPTYTKPLLCEAGRSPRELNRLDIKNRTPLPADAQEEVLARLRALWPRLDALAVLDQVSEPDCGVITGAVRAGLEALAQADPGTWALADSRERIGLFRNLALKPNERECRRAAGEPGQPTPPLAEAAALLAQRAGRPVFCTTGDAGVLVAVPGGLAPATIPAYPVGGQVDTVGAGDSATAGILCALAAGHSPQQAAAFGNLVASITIQQIGTTGTASPDQVRARWREVQAAAPS